MLSDQTFNFCMSDAYTTSCYIQQQFLGEYSSGIERGLRSLFDSRTVETAQEGDRFKKVDWELVNICILLIVHFLLY